MKGWESANLGIGAVVDFYNQINLLYGSMTEFCSPQSCPEMKATDEYASRPQKGEIPTTADAIQIRVLVARHGELQASHQNARTRVYRAPDGLGPEQRRQRADVP
jgi:hypothetical protein